MQTRFAVILAAALLASPILVSSAYSAGTSGGSSGGTVTKCKSGKVWDKKMQKCVTPKQGVLDDDSIYEAGRDLAMAGRYGEAITVLGMAADKTDPRILNYLGYANRKAGRMELGMSYYRKALQADENYILARSYMGQALVEQGDVQGARVQLVEIRDRGGEQTWAYRSLLQALNGYRTY